MSNHWEGRLRPQPENSPITPEESKKPRGLHGGRPSGSSSKRTRDSEHYSAISALSHDRNAEKNRKITREKLGKDKNDAQRALEYKRDHDIGTRPKVIVKETVVYAKAKRKQGKTFAVSCVDHLLGDGMFCLLCLR